MSVQTQTTKPKWTAQQRADHCRQIGGLGGRKTVDTYGVLFMREIAKIGFQTTADRFYDGNRALAAIALQRRGKVFRTTDQTPGLVR